MPKTDWSAYRTRNWYCPTCGRSGFILQHQDDTPMKATERRLQSHSVGQRRCAGELLRWTTYEEDARAVRRAGLPPLE